MIIYFQKHNSVLFFIKFLAWLFVLLLMLEVFIRIFVIKSPYLHFISELGIVPLDYLYISLGGNRAGHMRTYVNLMLTMLIGGLWHGASWNFVFWGGLHGAYLAAERIFERNTRDNQHDGLFSWLRTILVFLLVSFTWIFFRSPSLEVTRIIFEKILFIDPMGVNWWYTPAVLFSVLVVFGGLIANTYRISFEKISVDRSFSMAFLVFEYVFVLLFFTKNISPFIYFQF